MNWPAFQNSKTNLRTPFLGGEWSVEAEATPTVLTQTWYKIDIGMNKPWLHSRTTTAPFVQYNRRALEPFTKWSAFQYQPNLRTPLLMGDWSVEAEARPTILT